jgi:DNA-3-methyladenine glycosylase II
LSRRFNILIRNVKRAVSASPAAVRGPLTPDDYARARRLLMRRDPVLGRAIKQIGACGMASRQHADHLTALARAIVGQQLSSKAAATIFTRFSALFPDGLIVAPILDRLDDQTLRGVGLSSQKLGYMRDLSARVLDGRLKLDELETLDDELVIERLTSVKGFGRWTAEMFLMFRLHRPDVLPVGDLGIMNAVQRLYRLRKRPNPKRLQQIGEAWRPYRSVACWYLWQSLQFK